MSLVDVHRSLIIFGIAFCFVYAGWEIRGWLTDGGTGAVVMAGVFVLLGVGLTAYLIRLGSILKLED